MAKYWHYFKVGYLILSSYRSTVFFGLLRHFVIVSMSIFLWGTIFRQKSMIDGFDFRLVVTYYIFVEIIDIFYTTTAARVTSRDINKGDLNNYLTKPINYWAYLLFYGFGSMTNYVLLGIAAFIIGGLFFPNLIYFPTNYWLTPLTILIIIVSAILYNQIFYVVGLVTFWISDNSQFRSGIKQLVGVLGGRWIPLTFFPSSILTILSFTPFPFLFNYIFKVFSGSLSFGEIGALLTKELIWLAGLMWLGNILWKKGLKRYEAFGK